MPLTAGTRLGPYEITAPLGAGGMGEVYRARDSKLGRDVAIKVLPLSMADDAQYMARFEREAQTLASLNHPNIATVYGIEQGALVMELVEGQTLAERIEQGAVPLDDALPIARQICDGLEAAHERGIIHRDLKPANIKITPAGVVKLLDFGLAKSAGEFAGGAPGSSPTMSPTLSLAMTQAGMILGTAAYMSPEQARGKPVDRRADIWAFGVVLYEMLTGRQLFGGGETVTDTLASVVKDSPDLALLPKDTPAHIRRLLERCLRKDAKQRLRDIGDARLAIDEPDAVAVPVADVAPVENRSPWIPWAVAGVAIVAGAFGWWRATRPAELRPLVRMNVEISPDMTVESAGNGGLMAISPDGQRVLVTLRGADGKVRLHTRLLQQDKLTALAGTENGDSPFFSPDGQWIGFYADSKFKKISVEGGAAVTICEEAASRGASWGDDGNIVLAPSPSSPLLRVSSDGGAPAPLTKLNAGERTHRWPQVLPGSRAVLFTAHTGANNYDGANIDVVVLKTGERRTVQRGGFSGRYLAMPDGSGRLLYVHQGTLFAAPFDLGKLAVTGTAVPVAEEVSSSGNGGADYAVSATGTMVYLPGKGQAATWTISWVDGAGTKPLHGISGVYFTPRFSPDGRRLAFAIGHAGSTGTDVWVKDLDRDTPSRLSFLGGANNWPVWMPDSKGIIFKSADPVNPGLYWVRSDGAGEAQRLTDGTRDEYPDSISPDGKRLTWSQRGTGGTDLFTVPIEGDPAHIKLGTPELFVGTPFMEAYARFSPDGRWMAYASNESGTFEVYVRPFPGPGGRWQVSTSGGSFPAWAANGRELLYRNSEQRIMAVNYTAKGDSFAADKPRVWSETRVMPLGTFATWDLAPDGKRLAAFLFDTESQQKLPTHLTFLLNFADELQRRGGGK